jgi:lysyl-tRNA synthetase class 2
MKQRIRAYFAAAHVLEVDTPVLSPYAVSDPQIESLEITQCQVSDRPLYLHTSPEFCMKRLLVHQPEFTMLEWYRLGMGLDEIVADTVGVISAALDRDIDVDYRDAFIAACGLDPFVADIASLADAAEADDALRAAVGNERDDWLDLVLATRVTPQFAPGHLTVLRHYPASQAALARLCHYPASQAALARLCPDDNALADRFEVFLGPVELANGYVELTDGEEQRRRIETDNVARRRRGRPVRPVDELLVAALESGLPALGLERLLMLFNKTDDIANVITFTFQANA